MKHHYTTDQMQAAVDAALVKTAKDHPETCGCFAAVSDGGYTHAWDREAPARLHLARELIERLPEPPPPVVDGKTPGEVNHDAVANGDYDTYKKWSELSERGKCDVERGASAVLAAFGNPSLEAAIARMEAVLVEELNKTYWNSGQVANSELGCERIRARLIAAAKEGQMVVDWKAKYEEVQKVGVIYKAEFEYFLKKTQWVQDDHIGIVGRHRIDCINDYIAELRVRAEKAEADLAHQENKWRSQYQSVMNSIKDCKADMGWGSHEPFFEKVRKLKNTLPQLRPISEAGPVPDGCVRVYFYKANLDLLIEALNNTNFKPQ